VPATPKQATASAATITPSKAGKRRFQFADGSSDKFWEIEVAGAEVTVRYGRTGTNGQTNTKTFPDEAAAAKHADKLIAEKTEKGYQEAR